MRPPPLPRRYGPGQLPVRPRIFAGEITQFFFTRRAGRTAGPKSSCKRARFVRSSTAFFHGEVTITSVPNGAEILCGTVSLGFTPLTVALPAGNQVLTARLKNYPDRTQNVAVNENCNSHNRVSNARAPAHCQGETNTAAVVNWESRRQPETSFRRESDPRAA